VPSPRKAGEPAAARQIVHLRGGSSGDTQRAGCAQIAGVNISG